MQNEAVASGGQVEIVFGQGEHAGCVHQPFEIVGEIAQLLGGAAAMMKVFHRVMRGGFAGSLAGQSVNKSTERRTDEKIVGMDGEDRQALLGTNQAGIDPVRDMNFNGIDVAVRSLADDAVGVDERPAVNLSALAAGKIDDLDPGGRKAVERLFEFLVLASAVGAAAEFENVRGTGPVHLGSLSSN